MTSAAQIPFLPVSFFKQFDIKTGNFQPQAVFTSSTTTGSVPSRHYVKDMGLYEKSYMETFRLFYGDPQQYVFLALLPSYLERSGSSLVVMADGLIKASDHPLSGFYLYDFERLFDTLVRAKSSGRKIFLLGVTFALLDFADEYPMDLGDAIVMETGGMKGKRKEMIRSELHAYLQKQLNVPMIHSEYGMTELLSQAYLKEDGYFYCPPWMKIVITDANDPLTILPEGKAGLINVIDLANISSCAFIQTADLGRIVPGKGFEVLGRLDHSEVRGCNLMYL